MTHTSSKKEGLLSTAKIVDELKTAALLGNDVTYETLASYIRHKVYEVYALELTQALKELKEGPTINDVFPSEPYDGLNTYNDMLQVVKWYEERINNKIKELENQ